MSSRSRNEQLKKVNFVLSDKHLAKVRDIAYIEDRSVSSILRRLIDKEFASRNLGAN